jgi:polysaccharide export outer membrane protein
MRFILLFVMMSAAYLVGQPVLDAAAAQESETGASAGAVTRTTAASNLGAADDALSLGLTGERRPLYRLRKSDVLEIAFPFSPELNQTVSVLPDGFIALKGMNCVYVEGQTLPQASQSIRQAYSSILRDPEVSVVLKDFDKPYFIAAGEVAHPGKYELRSDTTVTAAVAIAGGFTAQARHSQVLLFRQLAGERVEARVLDVKQLLKSRNLSEDLRLRPGDMLFVPQNTISKVRRYLPLPNMGMYLNPAQF